MYISSFLDPVDSLRIASERYHESHNDGRVPHHKALAVELWVKSLYGYVRYVSKLPDSAPSSPPSSPLFLASSASASICSNLASESRSELPLGSPSSSSCSLIFKVGSLLDFLMLPTGFFLLLQRFFFFSSRSSSSSFKSRSASPLSFDCLEREVLIFLPNFNLSGLAVRVPCGGVLTASLTLSSPSTSLSRNFIKLLRRSSGSFSYPPPLLSQALVYYLYLIDQVFFGRLCLYEVLEDLLIQTVYEKKGALNDLRREVNVSNMEEPKTEYHVKKKGALNELRRQIKKTPWCNPRIESHRPSGCRVLARILLTFLDIGYCVSDCIVVVSFPYTCKQSTVKTIQFACLQPSQ
uniref:Uncharacterized protein n=1 Tax=Timema douglasi TaxID=61478 RepID=A0A7R8VR52_TIMDO|nr:unnamed protein product [Timema douglasi]